MKIRNGFVSNSSSSSFILKLDENFPDTISIAESMLKDKYSEYGWDDNDGVFKRLKKLRLMEQNDPYVPIYFTSTNYNTYIVPLTNNYIFIDTCNNIYWSIKDSAIRKIPDEVLEKYPSSETYGGLETYISYDENVVDEYGDPISVKYNLEYYLPEHGLYLTSPNGYKTCNKCYNDVWIFGIKEFCIKCDYDKILRAMKINKVKKSIF